MTFDPLLKSKLLLAMTAGQSHCLGNVWRITAKNNDFYLEDASPVADTMHVSVHGPQGKHGEPGFFLRVDRRKVAVARSVGYFIESYVPRRGIGFSGARVGEDAYHVVRLRWSWDLQRRRYRDYAYFGDTPVPLPTEQGLVQRTLLRPNQAWDVDLYVSYGEPYWPAVFARSSGDPRLGPLRNDAGHWLTGHSWLRNQVADPTPPGIRPRLPRRGETPNRMTCGGLGPDGQNFYWFVEAITSREVMADWDSERPNA